MTGSSGCTGSLLVSVAASSFGICAGGTVLKALIKATVDPLMSRCRQHIISLYSCNQHPSYTTFSKCSVRMLSPTHVVSQLCKAPTSVTYRTKFDYRVEFRTKQFAGCVNKGRIVLHLCYVILLHSRVWRNLVKILYFSLSNYICGDWEREFYLKIPSVPRSKHTPSRL